MAYESEYVCPNCGSLLVHSNPLTLESIKDVHNQHCIVIRQNSLATQAVSKPSIAVAPKPLATGTGASAPAATAATTTTTTVGAANTTISLSGTGTGYSKAEGPIDPDFKSKRQVAGTFRGIKVWGPIDAP